MIIRAKLNQHEFGEEFKEVLFLVVIAALDFLKIHGNDTLKHPSQNTPRKTPLAKHPSQYTPRNTPQYLYRVDSSSKCDS